MSLVKKFGVVAVVSTLILSMFLLQSCATGVLDLPTQKGINVEDGSWKLDFADEFDNEEFFYKHWQAQDGMRRAALNTSSKDHVFLKDGNLVLRTSWDAETYGGVWRTGFINTSTGGSFTHGADYEGYSTTYGYFEARCILPDTEDGIWSAFWMMPDAGEMDYKDGTKGAEIDIMESLYGHSIGEKNVTGHALHAYNGDKITTDGSRKYRIPNMFTEFHTYGVEWNETEYVFYIDGYETWRTKHKGKGKNIKPSQVNEFLKLTSEVRGTSESDGKGGYNITANTKNDKTKNYDFVIDYVRVYKKVN